MKRLLFLLSCLMIVSLSFADTVYGRLEKLEGNKASVRIYGENETSQVITVNLKNTMDKYLKQPLQARGQGVLVYDGNTLSQVDKDAADSMLFRFPLVVSLVIAMSVLLFIGIMALVCMTDIFLRRRLVFIVFLIAIGLPYFVDIFPWQITQEELVDYGKVTHLERSSCVIKNESGSSHFYNLSSLVFPDLLYDNVRKTAEGGILKRGSSYELYQSFGKDRNVIEATVSYVNKKRANISPKLKYIVFCSLGIFVIIFAIPKTKNMRQEKFRAKVEATRKKQEELKQQEYQCFCEELVTKFWDDYLDSPEKTSVLLKRLKVALQNSRYQNWKKEFYDVVAKRVQGSVRPSKEQRQRSHANKSTEDLGDIRINFNGIFVTSVQYRILSENAKVRTLSPDDLIIFCRKLAETMPEFRDFLNGKVVRTTQVQNNANEAYELFGLTFETLTEDSLKQAYRFLVQLYHPDKNRNAKAKEMFQKVQSYHAYLETELRRKAA